MLKIQKSAQLCTTTCHVMSCDWCKCVLTQSTITLTPITTRYVVSCITKLCTFLCPVHYSCLTRYRQKPIPTKTVPLKYHHSWVHVRKQLHCNFSHGFLILEKYHFEYSQFVRIKLATNKMQNIETKMIFCPSFFFFTDISYLYSLKKKKKKPSLVITQLSKFFFISIFTAKYLQVVNCKLP